MFLWKKILFCFFHSHATMWETLCVIIISYTITVTAVIPLSSAVNNLTPFQSWHVFQIHDHSYHFSPSSWSIPKYLISKKVSRWTLTPARKYKIAILSSIFTSSMPSMPLSNIKSSCLRVGKNSCWELGDLNLITSCWSNHRLSYIPTCKIGIIVVPCSQNGIQAQELTWHKYLRKCSQIYIMLQKCRLSVFSQPSGLNLIVSWENVKYDRFWHVKFPSMWLCSLHCKNIKKTALKLK